MLVLSCDVVEGCPVCGASCWACCDDAPGENSALSCKICHTTILIGKEEASSLWILKNNLRM